MMMKRKKTKKKTKKIMKMVNLLVQQEKQRLVANKHFKQPHVLAVSLSLSSG